MPVRVAILTVSDRSARGEREDRTGPALVEVAKAQGWQVIETRIVPDEQVEIEDALVRWCDEELADLVLTTGGTGFTPRDVTPEATMRVIERAAPGLVEAMRQESLKVTPHAMLSRAAAGIRRRTLIVNLPGSPKAAVENLAVIMPVIPHAVEQMQGFAGYEQGHGKI